MTVVDILEWICLFVTTCLFLSGIPPCLKMYRNRSTRNVPYNLFLLNVLSCSGMCHYGMMIGNSTLTILNGIGLILQCCYVLTYLGVTRRKTDSLLKLMCIMGYLVLLYTYLYGVIIEEAAVAGFLGWSASLIVTLIMALPAAEIYGNLVEKNADGVPAIMVLCTIISSTCWLCYGMMLGDANIYRPNFVGISVSVAKLLVIGMYGE